MIDTETLLTLDIPPPRQPPTRLSPTNQPTNDLKNTKNKKNRPIEKLIYTQVKKMERKKKRIKEGILLKSKREIERESSSERDASWTSCKRPS
jgi:hypothetical protein